LCSNYAAFLVLISSSLQTRESFSTACYIVRQQQVPEKKRERNENMAYHRVSAELSVISSIKE
jgi:hypothetical protein